MLAGIANSRLAAAGFADQPWRHLEVPLHRLSPSRQMATCSDVAVRHDGGRQYVDFSEIRAKLRACRCASAMDAVAGCLDGWRRCSDFEFVRRGMPSGSSI
jgi:hypothetical protein